MPSVSRADLPALVAAWPQRGRPVILVDGGSGSGKSTLAARIAQAWPGTLQVVQLDEACPGWEAMAVGSAVLVEDILRVDDPGYRRWDWDAGRYAGWVSLDPDAPLLVEGCGALTPASSALATLRVWIDVPERVRRQWAEDRAPGTDAWWEMWAAQERRHWERHRPWLLADVTVD